MKLSILMMAFNQGQYIDQAIASVFQQEMPFEWELVIGDDASIDNTSNIADKWVQDFPQKIKYYRHKKNKGLHQNYSFLVEKCQGEFIALLEADDYWLDPEKNAKQVALMDANPTIAWSFTEGMQVDSKGQLIKTVKHDLPQTFELEHYLQHFCNPLNNTIVFRKSAEPNPYPTFFYGIVQWDTVLHYLRALKGDIGFLPIEGLAWRRHEKANSFSDNFTGFKRYQDWLVINKNMRLFFPAHLHTYFKNDFIAYEYMAIYALKNKRVLDFFKYSFFMFMHRPLRSVREYRDFFWKIRNALSN